MAMDRATGGAVDVTGSEVRAKTGDTSGGTTLSQVIEVAATYGVTIHNRTGHAWGDFTADVKEGRGAILQGDYDQLLLCSKTFKDNHAIYVESINGSDALVGDPICRTGFRTVPLLTLRKYAERLGASLGRSKPQPIYYAVTDITGSGGDMVSTKQAGATLGTVTIAGAGHYLMSTSNTKKRYGPRAAGETLAVLATLDLVDATGKPIDIDGNQPPKGNRDQVYLVDAPAFGAAAFALRADCSPLAVGSFNDGVEAASKAALTAKK